MSECPKCHGKGWYAVDSDYGTGWHVVTCECQSKKHYSISELIHFAKIGQQMQHKATDCYQSLIENNAECCDVVENCVLKDICGIIGSPTEAKS